MTWGRFFAFFAVVFLIFSCCFVSLIVQSRTGFFTPAIESARTLKEEAGDTIETLGQTQPEETPTYDSQVDPNWTTAWNVPYEDQGEWTAPFTCVGPAVCEWWDQQGDHYDHEGFIILTEGQQVTFPANHNSKTYIGHWWELENDADAGRLMTTFRHLVFYSNLKTMAELRTIFGGETYNRFFGTTQVPYKPQHIYMAEFDCNFWDQSECAQLDPKVRHLPVGIIIIIDPD